MRKTIFFSQNVILDYKKLGKNCLVSYKAKKILWLACLCYLIVEIKPIFS